MTPISFFFKSLFSIKDDFKYLRQALSNKQAKTTVIPEYFWRYQICRISLFRSSFDRLPNFLKYNYCPLFHLSNFFVLTLPIVITFYISIFLVKGLWFTFCGIVSFFIDVFERFQKPNTQVKESIDLSKIENWDYLKLKTYQTKVKGKVAYGDCFYTHPAFGIYEKSDEFYDYYAQFYKTFGKEHKAKLEEARLLWEIQEAERAIQKEKIEKEKQRIKQLKQARKAKIDKILISIINIVKPVTKFVIFCSSIALGIYAVLLSIPYIPDLINGIKSVFDWIGDGGWLSILKWTGKTIGFLIASFILGAVLLTIAKLVDRRTDIKKGWEQQTTVDKFFDTIVVIITWPFKLIGNIVIGIVNFVSMFYSENCPSIEPKSEKVEKSA